MIEDFKDLQNKYLEIRKEEKEKNVDEKTSSLKLKHLAEKIRQLIGPVVVRRSRVDLYEIESYRDDLKSQ